MSDEPTKPEETTTSPPPSPEGVTATPSESPLPAAQPPAPSEPVQTTDDSVATATAVRTAPSGNKGGGYFWGTGRRKTAVARVRIRPGEGKFLVNKREIKNHFFAVRDQNDVIAPLKATKTLGKYDVFINVAGGGQTGQAGAVLLGLSRALMKANPELESTLRDGNYLTRDARKVERKKPGQPGARKRFQFSKR